MKRVYTIPATAEVVKLQVRRDSVPCALVIEPVRRYQMRLNPESRVPVGLSDGEQPTPSGGIDHDISLVPISPLWNFWVIEHAARIFGSADYFHMIGVAACTNSAEVVKGHRFWNRAVQLFPVPSVPQIESAIAANPAVAMGFIGRKFPTSRHSVYAVFGAPAVAGVVHLRLAFDVAKARLFGNRRIPSAPTETLTVPTDLFNRDLVVPLQEPRVASCDPSLVTVESDRYRLAACALAKAGGVRASRIVGPKNLAASPGQAVGGVCESGVVAFNESRLSAQGRTASAFAWASGWARWLRGALRQFGRKQLGVVAFDESAAPGKPAVGTDYSFSALALAKLAKVYLGHLISSIDRWSAGVECFSTPPAFSLYIGSVMCGFPAGKSRGR